MRFSLQISIAACILGPTALGRQFFFFEQLCQVSSNQHYSQTPISSYGQHLKPAKAFVLDSTFVSNSLLAWSGCLPSRYSTAAG
jgi:hypothetical protein